LLTNPVVLRATVLAFVLAYALIAIIVAVILGLDGDLRRMPVFMLALLVGFAGAAVLVLLVMLAVFRNRMRCRYALDDIGFAVTVVDPVARIGASLATMAGAGSGNATLAGAGLAAQAGGREYTRWDRISAVEFRPARRAIVMKAAGWWPVGAIHCEADSYAEVADRVRRIARSSGLEMVER